MTCPKCKTTIPTESKYCLECGAVLSAQTATHEAVGGDLSKQGIDSASASMRTPVVTTDGILQLYRNRDLNSGVIAQVPQGRKVLLGAAEEFEGREWMAAMLEDGSEGYVLAPSARGHTTLAPERSILKGIALTDNQVQHKTGPSGVGGWLIFPILGCLSAPLYIMYGAPRFVEAWTYSRFLAFVIVLAIFSGWSMLIAVGLLNRWPTAPRLAQQWVIGSFVLSFALWTILAVSFGLNLLYIFFQVCVGLVLTVAWYAYFRESWRVQQTYGPIARGPLRIGHAQIIAIVTTLVVFGVTTVVASQRRQVWSEYRSDDGLFTLSAPGSARRATLPDGTAQVLFGNDARGFVVLESDNSILNGAPEISLEGLRDKAIASMKGSIISSAPVNANGQTGIEFSATFPGKGIEGDLRGRVYKAGSKAFLLLVSGPQGDRTALQANQFFQSFQIKASK